jgi:hypothetical protein
MHVTFMAAILPRRALYPRLVSTGQKKRPLTRRAAGSVVLRTATTAAHAVQRVNASLRAVRSAASIVRRYFTLTVT